MYTHLSTSTEDQTTLDNNNNENSKRKENKRKVGHDGLFYHQQDSTLIVDDKKVKIDTITARLLVHFLDNPDRVISRGELTEQIWQSGYVSNNTITHGVSVLRKLLGGDINRYITTVPKEGYRFVHPEAEVASESNIKLDIKPDSKTHFVNTRWLVSSVVAVLLFLCLGVMVVFQPSQTRDGAAPGNSVMSIAVLPLVNKNALNKSRAPDQQLFVDGLTELVIHRLTRINGLVVLTSTQQSAADYLLQGSITQNGDKLRVTVQLTAADSGAYLFSTSFEPALKDVFALQENIATQVAAALKLSLIHKEPHYNSALATMDHQGVEQLVIARAHLSTNSDKSIKQAFDDLTILNQRYPQTPEVLGLLALVHHGLTLTPQIDGVDLAQSSVKLAKSALMLDSTNLDALEALYYRYLSAPNIREQAFVVVEQLLRHHPGRKNAWRSRLHLMIRDLRPCEEIQDFVNTIPQGLFTTHRLSVINHMLKVCLQSQSFKGLLTLNETGKTNQTKMNKAINNNLYLFRVRHDMIFNAVKSIARRQPSQSILADYYWLQLASGALNEAATTGQWISKEGFWPLLTSLYDTLYRLPTDSPIVTTSVNVLAFTKRVVQAIATHQFAAALIIRAKQSGDNSAVMTLLAKKSQLPVNLFNRHEVIALMMLQRHAGQQQASQLTAKRLFDKLTVYYKNHRQSFEFWGLGGFTLIAKFHCGPQCLLPVKDQSKESSPQAVLAQLFKPDHALWMDDIGFMQVALAPWASDPVVIEYWGQIEQDRVRFRADYGL
jgi:DNA-binding winged helix-turn-helix (wHTH) protein/TolB-like protein